MGGYETRGVPLRRGTVYWAEPVTQLVELGLSQLQSGSVPPFSSVADRVRPLRVPLADAEELGVSRLAGALFRPGFGTVSYNLRGVIIGTFLRPLASEVLQRL